jgi:RNA polymerase sigma-70 factor (ECF subfamily)
LATSLVPDRSEAEDVVQEALIRAWRGEAELRLVDNPWPWLARIVSNEAYRALARRRPEPVAEADDVAVEDEALERVLARLDLGVRLRTLHATDQTLLRLRYELDLGDASIAAKLGLSEPTVRVRLHRARSRLREALEPSS